MIRCPKCKSDKIKRGGTNKFGEKRFRCKKKNCGTRFIERTAYGTPYYYTKHPTEAKKIGSDDPGDVVIGKRKSGNSWDETDKSAVGSIITAVKPKTMDDASDLFQVDLQVWEPERMVINSWDVTMKLGSGDKKYPETKTNYQVKVWFKKRVEDITPEELAKQFKEHLGSYIEPEFKQYKFIRPKEDLLLEITNFDLHLGKLAWVKETGENYDLDIARQRFHYGINDLLNKAKPFKHSHCVFVVGNDFFQADNPQNETSRGTKVDTDVRWQKRYDAGLTLLKDGINLIRRTSPVDVLFIPGNHDWQNIYSVANWVNAWFRKAKNVNIRISAKARQYYYWEKILLGYTHGHNEKANDLFAIMANEASMHWDSAVVKEWHMGHWHHETTKDYKGVVVRWLKSQSGTDAWHYEKGFIGSVKGSEAFLYSAKKGIEANFHSNIII